MLDTLLKYLVKKEVDEEKNYLMIGLLILVVM